MEKHIISKLVMEEQFDDIKNINLQLKRVVSDVEHICLTCEAVVKAPIFGLYEKKSGALVNIMKGHEEPFVCKLCKARTEMLGRKKK